MIIDSKLDPLIWGTDDVQLSVVPGRGITNPIFIVNQLQKYLTRRKKFFFVFVDSDKAFDMVP